MKLKHKLFLVVFLLPVFLFAYDFGLTAKINPEFGGSGEADFFFRGDLWPRLSVLIGDNAELYVSAGLTFDYSDTFTFIPELLRAEFSARFGNSGIKIGRINYSDPLSFIASGLFDGAQYYLNTGAGRFSAGILYTGLLYKKTAGITMTDNDIENYILPLDYSNFLDTYFAPRKLIGALDWSHPSVFNLLRLNSSVILQFDLSGSGVKYHSQYLILKGAFQTGRFLIEAGGAVEFSQLTENNDSKFRAAFAGDLGLTWLLPAAFNSALSFSGKIAGGRINDTFGEFTPVTGINFGNIFKKKISALSFFDLNYSARFNNNISASLSTASFIRNDLAVVTGYPITNDSSGYFLGQEIYADFTWMPFSDLRLNAGGGIFIPGLGNSEKPYWRVDLNIIISIL
ncbi:MAG: hypothetical protein FWC21_06125 [Treponema sp.]|nr:hypothetical protein [Treponema sp.]